MGGPSHITLQLLGAGGAFTRIYGTTCSVLCLDDERWLIDCGRQAPDQLHAAGIGWHDIDGQLVTPQPGGFYGGWITPDVVGPFKGGPGTRGW